MFNCESTSGLGAAISRGFSPSGGREDGYKSARNGDGVDAVSLHGDTYTR